MARYLALHFPRVSPSHPCRRQSQRSGIDIEVFRQLHVEDYTRTVPKGKAFPD
jgi:hypothetical protein